MRSFALYLTRKSPPCPACDQTKEAVYKLRKAGVPVIEIDVNESPELANPIYSRIGIMTVPVLLLVDVNQLVTGTAISREVSQLLRSMPKTGPEKNGEVR